MQAPKRMRRMTRAATQPITIPAISPPFRSGGLAVVGGMKNSIVAKKKVLFAKTFRSVYKNKVMNSKGEQCILAAIGVTVIILLIGIHTFIDHSSVMSGFGVILTSTAFTTACRLSNKFVPILRM